MFRRIPDLPQPTAEFDHARKPRSKPTSAAAHLVAAVAPNPPRTTLLISGLVQQAVDTTALSSPRPFSHIIWTLRIKY